MPLVASRSNASAKAFGWSSAPSAEVLGGMVLMTPTSIASTGTGNSSSIGTNGSVTFSSCATLSLNGVFTSDYDNYMIQVRHKWNSSGAGNLEMRLRASGTDDSTASSYVRQNLFAGGTTVSGSRTTSNFTRVNSVADTQRDGFALYLYGPFLTQPTAGRTVTVTGENSAAIYDFAWTHNQSTAYDGFTLYPGSGTFDGLISVYGLGG